MDQEYHHLPLILLLSPFPSDPRIHFVNSSLALLWLGRIELREVESVGRATFAAALVIVLLTVRVAGWGEATTGGGGGALLFPFDPTVSQAPPRGLGTAGAALLASSAYRLPTAADVGLAAFWILAEAAAATAARCLRDSSSF